MSERLKSTSVSNDEVIDDLTKDLDSSLNTNDPAEYIINPGSSHEGNPPPTASGDSVPFTDVPLSEPDMDKDEKDDQSDTESINEEVLKDAEVTLTDDEKEERRVITEELKEAGNFAFKVGDYHLSIEKYTSGVYSAEDHKRRKYGGLDRAYPFGPFGVETLGLQTCPLHFSHLRAILYCNRSAARMKLEKYDKAIKDCTKSIELDEKYLKAYIRRAQSYEATDKLDESLSDYKKILELDPTHVDAQKAIVRLPPLIEQKNEKLKEEMLGKLKDLGNMILKPFGLSTSNFQMEQDPDTKGYKINFKQ